MAATVGERADRDSIQADVPGLSTRTLISGVSSEVETIVCDEELQKRMGED